MIMSTMTIQEQYNECKKKYPEAIVLFRTNDVYRAYNSDVEVVSRTLGLVSDTIGENEMIQFDCFKLELYLPKLIRRGHKVAIVEQI